MRIQHEAYYPQKRNITDTDTLVSLAEHFGLDDDAFHQNFNAPDTRQDALGYLYAQNSGIHGFPAMIAVKNEKANAVMFGFQPLGAIKTILASRLEAETS